MNVQMNAGPANVPANATATPPVQGATAVITHRIHAGRETEYEGHVDEIKPFVSTAPGYLDHQWIRPVAGVTNTYTIILRFDTEANLRAWMGSDARTSWIERAAPFFAAGDDFTVRSGLDFWFAPAGANRIPPRWKQFLLTWSAIFPLTLGVPFLVKRALGAAGISAHPVVVNFAVTGVVVYLMVYVVMPRYTRLVKRWLAA